MIKANELRIGNWVTELRNSRIVSIDGIEPNHEFVWVNYLNGFGQYKVGVDNIEPIPLTPEILEKCGFVLISKNSYWCFKNEVGFVLCMWMADSCVQGFEVKGSFYYGDSYIEIKYLHQLQNIYFSLTGEELDVKL